MTVKLREFKQGDFIRIRDFLVSSYQNRNGSFNWLIDRWNFCRYFAHVLNNSFSTWEKTVGIWEDESNNIVGIVNSEGENCGEAFFQVRDNISDIILKEMFNYAEESLSILEKGKRILRIRIPSGDKAREIIARQRDYKIVWEEEMSVLLNDKKYPVSIPDGFSIKTASEIDNDRKGLAHAKAFEYLDKESSKLTPSAYKNLKIAPDYNEDLDISILNSSGEIVAFCTIWFDEINKIGILEPVGTIPDYR